MSGNKLIITNIQRMCMNDGPGIRTTVFFKGCNLHCPWCANPENIRPVPEPFKSGSGKKGIYGREYTEERLLNEIYKDKQYWINGGGVTFSGGEPLLQISKFVNVMKDLQVQNVHMAVETALCLKESFVQNCLPYIQLFIIDMKILDPKQCKRVLGGNIELYYHNLELISKSEKENLFRIPCNEEYTLEGGNWDKIKRCLSVFPDSRVELFATHSLAIWKYRSLGLEPQYFKKLTIQELDSRKKELASIVKNVDVSVF